MNKALLRRWLSGGYVVLHRTLLYGSLLTVTLLLFVIMTIGAGEFFQTRHLSVALAVSSFIFVVLFWGERFQQAFSFWLYGVAYKPYQVLNTFADNLQQAKDPTLVLQDMTDLIAQTLQLPYVAVKLAHEQQPVSSSGSYHHPRQSFALVSQGERVGALVIAPRQHNPLNDYEDELLRLLARQAGPVAASLQLRLELERARTRLANALEDERRRFGRDLHDDLGPSLAALKLKLDAARNDLTHQPARAALLLGELSKDSEQLIAHIRQIVYALRPPKLDQLGLLGALQEGLNQSWGLAEHSLQVHWSTPETLPPLPAATEVVIYRIVQEAVTNILKHACAKAIWIRLWLSEQYLQLEVEDDGVGLPEQLSQGVGLNSMRERATELGGTFRLETVGTRTRVFTQLPVVLHD
jgi:signal transduction histidine kinase